MGIQFRQLLWVCNYAVAQSILYIQCFANCISKEAFFSLCQALQKLVARLIVTQEGLYPTALHFFSVLGIAANSLWFLPRCSQLCVGEQSGSLSGLLEESNFFMKQKRIGAQYRLSGVSSHPAGCRLPGFISPSLPFKDDKSVFLIKPRCDCKNTGWAGGGNLPLLKKRRSSKGKLDPAFLPSRESLRTMGGFFRVNHSGAQEEMLTSTLCFRALSICPVSDVALDSSANKRQNSVLELCAGMRKFHACLFGSKHVIWKKKKTANFHPSNFKSKRFKDKAKNLRSWKNW